MRWRHISLVARLELTDLRRMRGLLVRALLLPALTVVFFAFVPQLVIGRQEKALQRQTFDVAVQGDMPERVVERARADGVRLRFAPSDDARAAVEGKRAHVALVVDGDADAAVAAGGSAVMEALYLQGRETSLRALDRLVRVVDSLGGDETEARLRQHGLSPTAAQPVVLRASDLGTRPEGARLGLARAAAWLVVLPFTQWITAISQRITGAKDERSLEPRLLLPIARLDLLTGVGLAAGLLSLLGIPALIGPLLLVPSDRFGATAAPPLEWSMLPGSLVGFVLFAGVATALGLMLGAWARTSSAGSTIAGVTTMGFTFSGSVLSFTSLYTQPWSTLLPGAGPVALVQQAIAGSATVATAAGCAAVTMLTTVAFMAVATRSVASDAAVLRPSS